MDSKAEIAFRMNLSSLKRIDPSVVDIVSRASHVVLYAYDPAGQQWCKQEVEGTLFITKRAAPPYFCVVILNRLGTENHFSYLSDITSFQVHAGFITYEVGGKFVFGIWFLDEQEHADISRIFQSYCSQSNATSPVSSLPTGLFHAQQPSEQPTNVKEVENALKSLIFNGPSAAIAKLQQPTKKQEPSIEQLETALKRILMDTSSPLESQESDSADEQISVPVKLPQRKASPLLPASLILNSKAPELPTATSRPQSSASTFRPAFSDVPSQVMRASVQRSRPVQNNQPLEFSEFIKQYVKQVLEDSVFQKRIYSEYLSQFSTK